MTVAESADLVELRKSLSPLVPGFNATNETLADRTVTNESLLEVEVANLTVGGDYVRAAEAEAEAANLRRIESDTLKCAW